MKKLFLFTVTFTIFAALLAWRLWQTFRPAKNAGLFSELLNSVKIQEPANLKLQKSGIKVLSANLVAEFDKDQKLSKLKIMGEVQNISDKTIPNAVPIVYFLDEFGQNIAKKIAGFDEKYFLPPLPPKAKFLYAVAVANPPWPFASIAVNFEADVKTKNLSPAFSEDLKIEGREIEVNTASSSSGAETTYFRLKGNVENIGDKRLKNVAVVAYLKDENNQVFSWASQEFPSDLFEKNQAQAVNILLVPLKIATMSGAEVFTFGEEL